MYHLKLIKGKTYWGIVKASEEKPDVYVAEKEQAEFLVASGFFAMEGEDTSTRERNGEETVKAEEESEDDSFYKGEEEPADGQEGSVLVELQQKTKADLLEYAEQNGIDLTGCKTKDDIITRIIEELAKAAVARQAIRDGE